MCSSLASCARVGGAACLDLQQLREAEHRVQRRAQLVAHAREELRLGLALALGEHRLLARQLGVLGLGDVPVDADAAQRPAVIALDQRRARGEPAPAAVRQADAELVGGGLRRRVRRRAGRRARAAGRRDGPSPSAPRGRHAVRAARGRADGTSARPSARSSRRGAPPTCRCRRAGRSARRVRSRRAAPRARHAARSRRAPRRGSRRRSRASPSTSARITTQRTLPSRAQDAELDLLPSGRLGQVRRGCRWPTRSRSSGWTHSTQPLAEGWARGAARTGRRWRRSARSSRSRGGSIAVVHRPMPAACDAASSRRASCSACCRCSTCSVTSSATPTKASGSPLSSRSTTRRVIT